MIVWDNFYYCILFYKVSKIGFYIDIWIRNRLLMLYRINLEILFNLWYIKLYCCIEYYVV